MLKSLVLQNFIIVDQININFKKGFSIFTGETGAGKSIILEALLLTAGEKANNNLIKEGTDKATIIATYEINSHIVGLLQEQEIDIENNEVIIRRIITSNGSKAFINDVPVSVNLLKIISNFLLDIHGQFDNHKLLNDKYHIELVDQFISKELLGTVSDSYKIYKENLSSYNDLFFKVNNLSNEKEYLEFVIKELQDANIQKDEELYLIEKRTKYLEREKINSTLKDVQSIFNDENNIVNKIKFSLKRLENTRNIFSNNTEYNNLLEKFNNIHSGLIDCEALVNDIINHYCLNDYNIDDIEERLLQIRTLAKKHKIDSSSLPNLAEDLNNKLSNLQQSEDDLDNKLKLLQQSKEKFINISKNLSIERFKVAEYLTNKVNKTLEDLYLKEVKFIVDITSIADNENKYSFKGFDEISFKIINNVSEEAKNLSKVASGGELARMMLAIKLALAESSAPSLMVFDEIDSGVGGEVAYSIGIKLKSLSRFCQVLAITHSHQVASAAHYHYKVSKKLDKKVHTTVNLLNFDSRVLEVARMLSSDKITEEAKAIAVSLLNNGK